MNVLFVAPWDNLGGVCNVVNRVAQHMRAQGHGVHYLLPGTTNVPTPGVSLDGFSAFHMYLRSPSIPGNQVRSRLAFLLYFPVTLWRLGRLLRRLNVDVVNVHYPLGAAIYFATLRRLGRARLVTSIHGADLLPNGVRVATADASVGALLASSDTIVAPSEAYRRAAHEAWPEMDGRQTVTIPNGVDPEELGYEDRAPRGESAAAAPDGSAIDPPYVLSILQLVRYKGVDILLRAFAALAADHPALRLKLISGGPNRTDFEALARELGVADRVDFLGVVDRPNVARYLRGCTLFVLPSRSNSESFGIAAAEAMAVDRPVVASRVGGLPELIQDGETGLLVPPGEPAALEAAIRRLLNDPALGRALGTRAGIVARTRFLWKRSGILYEDVFRAVLPGYARSTRSPVVITAEEAQYPPAARTPVPPATPRAPAATPVAMTRDRL